MLSSREDPQLAQRVDKIYVFSVANADFGRIVASIDNSGKKIDGKNIFELLNLSEDDVVTLRKIILGYGKRPFATVCGKMRRRAVFFFKHFAFDTSLCLAIAPNISARRVSEILSHGVFDDVLVSDSLSPAALPQSLENAVLNDTDGYLHLASIFGQIMDLLSLRFQYASDNIESIEPLAKGLEELLGIDVDFSTQFDPDGDLSATDEIFDGRFCAAALLVCAITASKRSSSGVLTIKEVRGFCGTRVEMSFPCRRHTGLEAIYHMKKLAELNHGIRFDIGLTSDAVKVGFIPLYQDVGFVGVKNGDEVFDIVEYTEMF